MMRAGVDVEELHPGVGALAHMALGRPFVGKSVPASSVSASAQRSAIGLG